MSIPRWTTPLRARAASITTRLAPILPIPAPIPSSVSILVEAVKAVRIHKTGGPETLQYEDVDLPAPAPDQVRVRHTAIGVNFIDTYHREGLYTLPMPAILGSEAAGVVEAIGENVSTLKT